MNTEAKINLNNKDSQLIIDKIYPEYKELMTEIKRAKKEGDDLGELIKFNRRIRISLGVTIEFGDIQETQKKEVKDSYVQMIKISDMWFSFEKISDIYKKQNKKESNKSKTKIFSEQEIEKIGINESNKNFNTMLENLLSEDKKNRQEIHGVILPYLCNNTTGGTKNTLDGISDKIKQCKELEMNEINALAYGIRNIYAHEGATAALGSSRYAQKNKIFKIIYDTLVINSFMICISVCKEKLAVLKNTAEI